MILINARENSNVTLIVRNLVMIVGTTAVLLAFLVYAEAQPSPVKWAIKADTAVQNLKAGEKLTVEVIADISEGWHIYSLTQPEGGPKATRMTMPSGQQFKLSGTIEAPKPRVKFEESFGMNTEIHEGKVEFSLPVKVDSNATEGTQKLLVDIYFQACSEKICLMPRTITLETGVSLVR
jgi:cytochrome c biogenesis DsbD-like protein